MQAKLHALSPELESLVSEPYYQVIGNEFELFSAAAENRRHLSQADHLRER